MQQQYIVNAFERGPFTGNPAAVVPLGDWLPDELLQSIAMQNNLSETAFFVDRGRSIELRWFTPSTEIALCGHATLASAHVLLEELGDDRERLRFTTMSGDLEVGRSDQGYSMDFPAAQVEFVGESNPLYGRVLQALGVDSAEVGVASDQIFVVLEDAAEVRELAPRLGLVVELPREMVTVSAIGGAESDIVCRVFAPAVGIDEDPVTGAAHCALAPYWCERLAAESLTSHQLSSRGGVLQCRWRADSARVDLIGRCRTFSRGSIEF